MNVGTNGTLDGFVADLLVARSTLSAAVESLDARLDYLELLQPGLPRSCEDIASTLFNEPVIFSTLYDIYPSK